jgi:hypothetical protein
LTLCAPLALVACGSGEQYGGCATTNGMSVANGKVVATVTLDCQNVPERHHISIQLQVRSKKHPGWVTAQDLADGNRYAHHTFHLSNVCIPGEWRMYVKASATFKGKTSPAEGPSPILNTVGKC